MFTSCNARLFIVTLKPLLFACIFFLFPSVMPVPYKRQCNRKINSVKSWSRTTYDLKEICFHDEKDDGTTIFHITRAWRVHVNACYWRIQYDLTIHIFTSYRIASLRSPTNFRTHFRPLANVSLNEIQQILILDVLFPIKLEFMRFKMADTEPIGHFEYIKCYDQIETKLMEMRK